MQPLLTVETEARATRSPRQQSPAQQKADLDEEARMERLLTLLTADC